MVILGSYNWKISKRKVIFSVALLVCFVSFICMALFLHEKAYYVFVTNVPFGAILYLASACRLFEATNEAIVLDISYLVIILGMICGVVASFKKPKAIRIVYAVCACDIILNLCIRNFIGIIGDVLIIIFAKFGQRDCLREPK